MGRVRRRRARTDRQAQALIERFGLMLLCRVRVDGTPRITPIEAHLVGDRLMLVVIAGSRKADDVSGDPRIVLKSSVIDPADPGTELVARAGGRGR